MDPEPRPPAPGHAPDPAALRQARAFVTDPETRFALLAALPEWELEADDGNIRTAIGALQGNASPALILIDLDGVPYPVGSIHELASVCEVGATVVAIGSRDDARYSRAILNTGVADYLIKPVAVARVREVVARAFAGGGDQRRRGRSAGFIGTGGSGATTLLAATAITAAARGRYVAVLDLNRAFSALPFLLDVQPAPGLDELLESAAAGAPDPELVAAAQVARSDRLAVFGYRWNPPLPLAPSFRAVGQLVAELCTRFHLVLVDPEAHGRIAVLRDCDVQVLVSEPTRIGALRSARVSAPFGSGASIINVRNRTRALGRAGVRNALRASGAERKPDVEFPFADLLPELSDWGHLAKRLPRRLPRRLRKPLDRLVDRLDAPGLDVPGDGLLASPAAA